MSAPDFNHPNNPIGNGPPLSWWPVAAWSAVWAAFVIFLAAMAVG